MFIFNETRMQAFGNAAEENFLDSLYQEMCDAYPELFNAVSPELSQRMFDNGIKRTEAAGIETKNGTAAVMHYMAEYGADVVDVPEIRDILHSPDREEAEHIEALHEYIELPETERYLLDVCNVTVWLDEVVGLGEQGVLGG